MNTASFRARIIAAVAITATLFGAIAAGAPPDSAAPPAGTPGNTAKAPSAFREITWDELMPKDWDPYKKFRGLGTTIRSDADPRARALMDEVRAVWDSAPTVAGLEGAVVKLPGYVVPLEELRGELKEFLLVPYFGACIHTPPPPANQIVFVVPPKGVKFRAMDTVWVSGTLHTTRQASYMGSSGYRIDAATVERYAPP
jgi:hypothetical protein